MDACRAHYCRLRPPGADDQSGRLGRRNIDPTSNDCKGRLEPALRDRFRTQPHSSGHHLGLSPQPRAGRRQCRRLAGALRRHPAGIAAQSAGRALRSRHFGRRFDGCGLRHDPRFRLRRAQPVERRVHRCGDRLSAGRRACCRGRRHQRAHHSVRGCRVAALQCADLLYRHDISKCRAGEGCHVLVARLAQRRSLAGCLSLCAGCRDRLPRLPCPCARPRCFRFRHGCCRIARHCGQACPDRAARCDRRDDGCCRQHGRLDRLCRPRHSACRAFSGRAGP
ncbi:hypothetical protein ACVITL_002191 [Rhizobium pisi]